MSPVMWLKAIAIMLVGIPVMVALMVGAPLVWWDANRNFGLKGTDTPMFLLTGALATIVVVVAARAYWRVIIKKEAESQLPRILTQVFPLQVLAGVGLALFAVHGIHEQRMGHYTYFAKRHCAAILCPVPDGELLFEDDCEAERPDFGACFEVAWDCQKTHAATEFERRDKAERACIAAQVKGPQGRGLPDGAPNR